MDDGFGFVVAPGDGQTIELPGWSMLVKVGADATGGAFTVVHGRIDPGHGGPAEHIHDGHEETFFVLDGALRFRLGDEYRIAAAGSTVYVPRQSPHGFSNPFETSAAYLALLSPSGYERYFGRVAAHVSRIGGLPDRATSDAWMAAAGTRRAEPV